MTRHFLESLWNGSLEIPEAWTTPDKVNMAQWRFLSGHVIVKLLQYTKASWVRWHVPTIPVLGWAAARRLQLWTRLRLYNKIPSEN